MSLGWTNLNSFSIKVTEGYLAGVKLYHSVCKDIQIKSTHLIMPSNQVKFSQGSTRSYPLNSSKLSGFLRFKACLLFPTYLWRTQKDVWQLLFKKNQRFVHIFKNSDDRVGHLHVGLGPLQDLERIEGLANGFVTAKCHHLMNKCVANEENVNKV